MGSQVLFEQNLGQLTAGSLSYPTIAFDYSRNSGFYRPAAGQIGLSIAGVQQALWQASGFSFAMGTTGYFSANADGIIITNMTLHGQPPITAGQTITDFWVDLPNQSVRARTLTMANVNNPAQANGTRFNQGADGYTPANTTIGLNVNCYHIQASGAVANAGGVGTPDGRRGAEIAFLTDATSAWSLTSNPMCIVLLTAPAGATAVDDSNACFMDGAQNWNVGLPRGTNPTAARLNIGHTGYLAMTADYPALLVQAGTLGLSSGVTIAEFARVRIGQVTFTGVAGGPAEAVTVGASLIIDGAPVQGANLTLSTAYAALVKAGAVGLGGPFYPATPALATQVAASIYAGSGVPNNANGANGDFYFRSDGTVAGSTVAYHKEGVAWAAFVTT